MEQRHKEYIEYYEARVKKFAGSKIYKNLIQTETALRDAMKNAEKLEDFKAAIEKDNLPLKNAIALTHDQETAWKNHYEEINEPVRAKGPAELLEFLKTVNDLQDLITKGNEIRLKNSHEISIDLMISEFYSAFIWMENIEVWETAEIPNEWKSEMKEWVRDSIQSTREVFFDVTLPSAKQLRDDFEFNWENVWEERHRRLIPVPDESIRQRIAQIKSVLKP